MEPATLLMLIGVAGLIIGLVVVRRQSKLKGRWGVGSIVGICPRCGEHLPTIRKPTTSDEAMWGGWTCPSCGCKVDKYGRVRE